MRIALVLGVAIAGCFRGPATEPRRPAPGRDARSATNARPANDAVLLVAPASDSSAKPGVWVSGCNAGCIHCSLGDYRSFVVGLDADTGARLFPRPSPPSPGYSCRARVAFGDRVTLRAHSTSNLEIVRWAPFSASDSCPCAGTAGDCTFVVTPEIASHGRLYCGATWAHRGASIAH